MWSLTGWIFSMHHPEGRQPSLIQILFKKLCFVQLWQLKQCVNFMVSQLHLRSHQVNQSKQARNKQGLFWGVYGAAPVTGGFSAQSVFSTCCLCTCNYFKIPSQLADPFHRLARKGSLGIFKGELRNVNRLELQSSAVCQRAVQPLIVQQVMCALLKKLI